MPRPLPELGVNCSSNIERFLFLCLSEGSGCPEDEGNYLDMSDLSDPPNYDDFMYLRLV